MGKPQKLGLQQNHQNGKTKENWVQSDNLPKTLAQPLKNLKQNQSDIKSFHQIAPPPPPKKKKTLTQRETPVLGREAKGMKTETKNAAARHSTSVVDLLLRETKKAPARYFPLSS